MQSIIVYRNPLEAAMWEGIMSSGALWPVMVGVAVFFAVFLIADRFIIKSWFNSWRLGRLLKIPYAKWDTVCKVATNVSLAVSALAGVFVVWYML